MGLGRKRVSLLALAVRRIPIPVATLACMNLDLRRYALPAAVFMTGACVLVVEVVATRILSPYYGNTIFTVSSVISVILAALSAGYYAGGKIADRYPSRTWFYGIILAGGIALLAFHALGLFVLPVLSGRLSLATGPLVFSMLLFFLPSFLLGTLSPFAVKLQNASAPEQGVGSVAGSIFFWSTLGSIAGSLLAGFVLIPTFGINRIMIGDGAFLFVLGLGPLAAGHVGRKKIAVAVALFAVLAAGTSVAAERADAGAVFAKDGVYEKLVIRDGEWNGRPARFFLQDRSVSGGMYLDSDDPADMTFDYTKYYALYHVFAPDVRRALVIGGGAYTVPKALLAELPGAVIDVSEIEPSLPELAETYFHLPRDPRLRHSTEDGRRFLAEASEPYDLIFSDVYYSLYSIPSHFTTREFFALAKDRLSENGVFIANFIGDLSRRPDSFTLAEMKTFRAAFPNSFFFATDSPADSMTAQNIIFVGLKDDRAMNYDAISSRFSWDVVIAKLPDREIDTDRFDFTPYPVLTDDYAPTEYLTGKTLSRAFGASAVRGDEMLALVEQQLRYGSRAPGTEGHEREVAFLTAEMRAMADEVRMQSWERPGPASSTRTFTNVIARFDPANPRRILIGAHYDTKRTANLDPHRPDLPLPGANDGASGIAALVELARLFAAPDAKLGIGVDLVFFDGEEGDEEVGIIGDDWMPIGSECFAEHLVEFYPSVLPESAIILDMIGDRDLKIAKEPSSVAAAPALVDALWAIGSKVDRHAFDASVMESAIHDDHTPFIRAGIPSALLIDYDYPPYHTTRDTADQCSAESLRAVTLTVARYVFGR